MDKNKDILNQEILMLSKTFQNELINIRRHIHQNPELSYQEEKTMDFVSKQLSQLKIEHETHVNGFGIIAEIGPKNNNCVALRGDMDALPINEINDQDYCSKNEGVMHACGHDVHTTCLLGAAKILKHIEDQLTGCVRLIFQPAEEVTPGGALGMIKAGVLSKAPKVSAIFGLHVYPLLEVGDFGFKPGMFMAAVDTISITIQGKGGHAAVPREFIDPIAASATLLTQLQTIVSRRSDPGNPTVLSFGKIESIGGTFNVIPSSVELKGTLRTMNESWRKEAHQLIKTMCEGVALANHVEIDVQIDIGYPALINDAALNTLCKSVCIDIYGAEKAIDIPFRMSGEDFARYLQKIPGVFFRLGTGNKLKGISAPVHSPFFDVDEDCLHRGAAMMSSLAVRYLRENSN